MGVTSRSGRKQRRKSFIRDTMDTAGVDKIFEDQYPLTVSLIGSGNWGSAIAKIVGGTVKTNWRFSNEILMYVYEEDFQGRKLSEVINEIHENPKYLPGHKIPENVRACPNLAEVVAHGDILIFVLPHQFVVSTCQAAKPYVKPNAFGLSLIKGFLEGKDDEITLISNVISQMLAIPCDVLMGANIAREVAEGQFCEATLGSRIHSRGHILKSLLRTHAFRITVSSDKDGVEVCGAAKNAVALGAGMVRGMDEGKQALGILIQHGMLEMMHLMKHLCESYQPATIMESCGFADIIASADGGRNARVAEQFVRCSDKSWDDLEREMLNGQKLQGVQTAAMIYFFVKKNKLEQRFPLLIAIHEVCVGKRKAPYLLEVLSDYTRSSVREHLDEPALAAVTA